MPNQSPDDLPDFRKGQVLRASELNKIVHALVRRMSGGEDIAVKTFGDQILLSIRKKFTGRKDTVLKQFQVQSVQQDYLVCRTLSADGTVGTKNFNVAKPWTMRQRVWDTAQIPGVAPDGAFYTYTFSSMQRQQYVNYPPGPEDPVPDSEFLEPFYYAGAVLLVMEQDAEVSIAPGITTKLVDVNADGRHWHTEEPIATQPV